MRQPSSTAQAAALLMPLTWVVVRLETPLASPGTVLDAIVLVVASSSAFWLARALSKAQPTFARAAGLAARLWPFAAIAVALSLSTGSAPLLAFLAALHYSVLVWLDSDKRFAVVAAGFANASLFASFAVFGFGDLLAYALPIGITALVLVHVYAKELGEPARQRLRW